MGAQAPHRRCGPGQIGEEAGELWALVGTQVLVVATGGGAGDRRASAVAQAGEVAVTASAVAVTSMERQ